MIRKARTYGAGLLAVLVLLLLIKLAYTAYVKSSLKRDFLVQGFPIEYAKRLAEIKYNYPTWTFAPIIISDLKWDDIVARECHPAMNLVVYSTWAPNKWAKYGVRNYKPYYAENARAYDSGAWFQASRDAIAYFMDPRNFLYEQTVFMFETMEYKPAIHTVESVERVLASTFMANAKYDDQEQKFSELLVDIGKRIGISPVFLAGRLASEQGNGSVQALGKIGDSLIELFTNEVDRVGSLVVWGRNHSPSNNNTKAIVSKGAAEYNGHYNFFNIGACGDGIFEIRYNAWRESVAKETCEKYCGPWNTQARAIEGGAIRIKSQYMDTFRHTRYFQKFSVLLQSGKFRWKQYMQNIAAPLVEARNVYKAYKASHELHAPHNFLIPIYIGMPKYPAPDPAHGDSVYSSSN